VIITSAGGEPLFALDADGFLRGAVFSGKPVNILSYCHRPIIVIEGSDMLGDILPKLKVEVENTKDDVIDHDLILYWGDEKRIITGADLFGRLMRGISKTRLADR
jgi:hypothetical protein